MANDWYRLPDSTMFVADGYNGTRVAKFDKDGKFLLDWGQPGRSAQRSENPETRPGYMNAVHGIAVNPTTRRVYVSDRTNRRIQVFDENGKYLSEWPVEPVGSVNFLYIGADGAVWAQDNPTSRMVKYDAEGRLQYSWGTLGNWPGGFSNMHGMTVDQEGNLYVVEVGGGRVQKFRPKPGANPEFLVSKPVYAAWK
jgi:streptogramin lyase